MITGDRSGAFFQTAQTKMTRAIYRHGMSQEQAEVAMHLAMAITDGFHLQGE